MKGWKLGIKQTGYYMCEYGGWNCKCCSPLQKDRPLARRSVRRLMHQQDKQVDTNDET